MTVYSIENRTRVQKPGRDCFISFCANAHGKKHESINSLFWLCVSSSVKRLL